jgi:hypothetical protein
MILDSEEQREIILQAMMEFPIQGDYAGITQQLPRYTAVVEAVKTAPLGESQTQGKEE